MRLSHLLALGCLLLPAGCKSPNDIGFEAGAKYMSIWVAVGADTTSMKCPERLDLAKEFYDKGKADREALRSKVEGAREDPEFDKGMGRLTDMRPKVYAEFARTCPEQAPKFAEMMTQAEGELGITGKLPELKAEPAAP